jgi:hypothetical protein
MRNNRHIRTILSCNDHLNDFIRQGWIPEKNLVEPAQSFAAPDIDSDEEEVIQNLNKKRYIIEENQAALHRNQNYAVAMQRNQTRTMAGAAIHRNQIDPAAAAAAAPTASC